MLMGQYEHSIDPKNRINFPAKFRDQLGENFILTVGLDECIAVYSAEERDELQEYINDLQKEIDYYWGKFLERKRQKESYVFEKEIENIMAWKSQLDTILDTENP